MTETKMPPTYNELVERRLVLQDEIERTKRQHEQEIRILYGKLEPVERAIAVAEDPNGISAVQFQLARSILIVDWGRTNGIKPRRRTDPEIQSVIADAIEEIRKGGGGLRRHYLGLKQYDQWAAQREDHDYGFGPRHGSIWFKIGMTEQYRRRPEWLQEYERVACVQWLNAIRDRPDLLDTAGL